MDAESENAIGSKVALVTGGNLGIGGAISRRLARDGYSVGIGFFEDQARADALATELQEATGRPCIAIYGDVTSSTSVTEMVERVTTTLGGVSVLVNNAGVAKHTPFLEIGEEEWRWMFDVHVSGAVRSTQAVLPQMISQGYGRVINIVSQLALVGQANLSHYVAAKNALIGLTKSLAREFAPKITVNAVAPGPTDTRILSPREHTEEFAQSIPLQRLGRPEEIAAVVGLLCSPDGSWFTGQVISPNGGTVI